MRKGTSGFWVRVKGGSISIGYEDYGVSEFGGGDFEKTYTLSKENSEKLITALKEEYTGTLREMLEAAFTRNFDDPLFCEFCKKHGIEYTSSTWCG